MQQIFERRKKRYSGTITNQLRAWSQKLEQAFRPIKGIKKLQTFSISRSPDAGVLVVGRESHLPNSNSQQISFHRPTSTLCLQTPTSFSPVRSLSPKLLEDLKKAQKYLPDSELIEYVSQEG